MGKTISPEEFELIGALIGDGHIYRKKRKYIIGFTGNPITDFQYFERLKSLIKTAWKKDARLSLRERAVRIQFDSKPVVERLIGKFGMPFNRGKCLVVKIPEQIEKDWNLASHTIRGIADTDGSVFTANKPGSPNYPSIEITTVSRALAWQLKAILCANGFRVAKIWSYKSKNSVETAYKVPLNGRDNLRKWVSAIGFSNPVKLSRALGAMPRENVFKQ